MLLSYRHWAVAGLALVTSATVAVGAAAINTSVALTNTPGYENHPGAATLPPGPDGTDPRTDFGLAYQDISFPAVDGSTLRGWLVPGSESSVGVVTVHGRGMDRRAFLPHLPMLHDLAVTTLLFDLREHGLSDGTQRGMSMGFRETQDVESAVAYLRGTGVARVIVLGMSLGAGSAILAAAEDHDIDGVIAESPYTSMYDYVQQMADQAAGRKPFWPQLTRAILWPQLVVGLTSWRQGVTKLVSPIDVISQIAPRPLLLIHGTADTAFFPENSERLFAQAGQPKRLWLADGAEHTRVYEAYPEPYRDHLAAIIKEVAAK